MNKLKIFGYAVLFKILYFLNRLELFVCLCILFCFLFFLYQRVDLKEPLRALKFSSIIDNANASSKGHSSI